LVRAVGIEEAQRDGRNVISLPDDQTETFLVVFRQRINRFDCRGFAFGGRHRFERPSAPIEWVPLPPLQLQRAALGGFDKASIRRAVEALAINAHAGGDDEPVKRPALRAFDHHFKKHRGAAPVDVGVVGNLIHALADPDPRGKMDHRIDIRQGAAYRSWHADIAYDQFDATV